MEYELFGVRSVTLNYGFFQYYLHCGTYMIIRQIPIVIKLCGGLICTLYLRANGGKKKKFF